MLLVKMDSFGNRHDHDHDHDDHLGVNKIGRNIKKSPPNFTTQPPLQPQVYNINKHDFRNIVQQLTGSPSPSIHSQEEPVPVNPKLQKIRPSRLAPIHVNRPPQLPPPLPLPPMSQSPISAYMSYLQHSIIDSTQNHTSFPPSISSPTSQFVLSSPSPSPSAYLNLLSPISPVYPQFPPLTPSFSFSPLAHFYRSPGPQPTPPSPGMGFPSPGFFNLSSPRWRN